MTHETTAPVQSLVDEVLADLDSAEKTHLDGEVRDMARDAIFLIRQQQALIARHGAPPPPVQQPSPIGKVLSEDEMAPGYDRRMGRIVWFGTPAPGFIYAAPPAQQPVAALKVFPQAFVTAESCQGKYRIVMSFESLDSMHTAHRQILALLAAPGDTAAPEQADLQELREEIGGLKSVNTMLTQALKRLTFCARTTGGTTGPDAGFGRAYMEGADAAGSAPEQAEQEADGWVVIAPDGGMGEIYTDRQSALDIAQECDLELSTLHTGPAHRVAPIYIDTRPEQAEQDAVTVPSDAFAAVCEYLTSMGKHELRTLLEGGGV